MNQKKTSPLEGLNPQQIKAVKHATGPLLILAGAGTGKTRVITHRIAYLIEGIGILPQSILALTFTNKAAQEMRERTVRLAGEEARGVMLSTFHSFCNYILRRDIRMLDCYREGYSIYDESDTRACIKTVLKDMGLPVSGPFAPARVSELISRAKNFGSQPGDNIDSYDPLGEHIERIAAGYERRMVENNALDFDNLLIKTLELFKSCPDVCGKYRRRFDYLLVDEYQDTNRMQYELLRLLAPDDGNVTVVGDLDQSIYGWRGADVGNMISFQQDFKDVSVVALEQNYRSSQNILDAANLLIANNPGLQEKRLWSDLGAGEPVFLFMPWDEREEAHFVALEIDHLIMEGYRLDDIAVLFRTKAQSRVLEETLLREGVPYMLIGATEFYKRKEIKDIVAYLRVIENPRDFISFGRIANEPKRGLGPKSVEAIEAAARAAGSLFDLPEKKDYLGKPQQKKALPLIELLKSFHDSRGKMPLDELVREVAETTGYLQMLDKLERTESISRTENVEEFVSLAAEHAKGRANPTLDGFLSHVALLSDVDLEDFGEGRIRMLTLHAAKGLEFPVVFMVGVEEGLLPHRSSSESDAEMQEERRLCYVGITRAQELLYMTACKSRLTFGQVNHNPESRFINEIGIDSFKVLRGTRGGPAAGESFFDDDEPDFEVDTLECSEFRKSSEGFFAGDRVAHEVFGTGTVVSIKGDEICIAFPGKGVKRLSSKFAPLRKL